MAPTPLRDIVIFGSGGYARCIAETVDAGQQWRVAAFADRQGPPREVLGRPVVDEDELLASSRPFAAVIGIGDNWMRQQMVTRIQKLRPDVEFGRIVDPRVALSPSAEIGEGCVILAGSIVNSSAKLGEHVLIYTNAVVEHDDVMADYCSLAPGAVLGGAVKVGLRSFIGLNVAVIHNIRIAEDVVVGAGAVIIGDCAPCSVVVGNPGRVIATRKPGDRYL